MLRSAEAGANGASARHSPVLGGASIEALAELSYRVSGGIDLAFVDPDRLGDLEALAAIRAIARSVIGVGTDRSLHRFGDMDNLAATMGLALLSGCAARVSATLSPAMDRLHLPVRRRTRHECNID